MKILARNKLKRTIILAAGDKLTMNYVEVDGVIRTERVTSFATVSPDRSVRANTALLVETMVDGAYAIGALLIEEPDTATELTRKEVERVSAVPIRSARSKQRPM